MNDVLKRLSLWSWYLIPANPILVRVVHGGSRRVRHLWLRLGYLSALLTVVLFSLVASMSGENASLAELAKGASRTFAFAATTQLALMCVLAPVFTAAAITQERDGRTFNILISTPLTNAQIVFGSLLSRLYFVVMLLVSGLPIFLMTMVYGGVTSGQIFESFALAGATACITGALAITVSMIRVGTQRTIFSFYLVIALYLLSLYAIGMWWPAAWVPEAAPNFAGQRMSWLAPLHPFLALDVALNRVQAPTYAQLADYSRLTRFALAYPSAAYVIWTLLASLMLTTFSVLFVRRGTKTGEETFFTHLKTRLLRREPGERRRPPRNVWSNPVAWREAKTRGAGGGATRWLIVGGGVVACLFVFIRHVGGSLPANQAAAWLAAIIAIQFGITLLVAASTAATAITKERDARTLDILLTTILTSRYVLWGKLRGLVSFCLPMIGTPVLTLLIFGLYGLFGANKPPAVWIEAALELGVLMVLFTALACVIGLKVSVTSKNSVTAIMYSVGVLVVGLGVCTGMDIAFVRAARGEFGAFLATFTPFTSIMYLVNPMELFDSPQDFRTGAAAARALGLIGAGLASAILAAIVTGTYRSLVRDFDMTMRRQSAG